MKKRIHPFLNRKTQWIIFISSFFIGLGISIIGGRLYDIRGRAVESGKTYFVSPSGSDTNDGISLPFKTVYKGVSVALPGDTIVIKQGVYYETLTLSGKKGTQAAPITIIGESANPQEYPILDGGDAVYSNSSINKPVFSITNNSEWLTFERLKIRNSSTTAYSILNSRYIIIRRNILDFHKNGIFIKDNSHHILFEKSEACQTIRTSDLPDTKRCDYVDPVTQSRPYKITNVATWGPYDSRIPLKSSIWEGGAFGADTGIGMYEIRQNFLHDQFNSVYFYTNSSARTATTLNSNIWVYRNRFENIIDDPFEPESWAYNNHFFQNTLINTHRMISLAPPGLTVNGANYYNQGPIYVYDNMMIVNQNPSGDVRKHSNYKLDFSENWFTNGVYGFNNSTDLSSWDGSLYGVELLTSNVKNFKHYNHVYKMFGTRNVLSSSSPIITNSVLDYDLTNTAFGITEPNGIVHTDPNFTSIQNEDLRPLGYVGSSKQINCSDLHPTICGFESTVLIPAGADRGSFDYGDNDFRTIPKPKYLVPPGGTALAVLPWPIDKYGGYNPPSGPKWSPEGKGSNTPAELFNTSVPTPSSNSTPTSTLMPLASITATPKPSATSTPKPSATPSPTVSSADTTPPVITISKPTNGMTIGKSRKLQYAVTASDPSGISAISLTVDGTTQKTCLSTTSCSGSLDASSWTSGTHSFAVEARDNSVNKNSSQMSISIIK